MAEMFSERKGQVLAQKGQSWDAVNTGSHRAEGEGHMAPVLQLPGSFIHCVLGNRGVVFKEFTLAIDKGGGKR